MVWLDDDDDHLWLGISQRHLFCLDDDDNDDDDDYHLWLGISQRKGISRKKTVAITFFSFSLHQIDFFGIVELLKILSMKLYLRSPPPLSDT